MIKKLDIGNFKCIDTASLELSKLNLLTGPNSAGKSTIIQALLLLIQSVTDHAGSNANVLNGEFVKLGKAVDIRNIYTNQKQAALHLENTEGETAACVIALEAEDEIKRDKCQDVALKGVDIVYLNSSRIGVEEIYSRNLESRNRIGTRGEYAFDYLSQKRLEQLDEPSFAIDIEKVGRNLGNQVDYWLEYILGYRINADNIENTNFVRVVYEKTGSNRPIRPFHIGTGVSYVANLIVAALSCKKESIFIVENPEIHLHPAAQSKITEFFAFLATRGLQIVIETHSDHIFNGIRKLIHKGKITTDEIAAYFIYKNESECSKTVKIQITKEGKIKNQQKGLFDQFDEDLDELLDLNDYE